LRVPAGGIPTKVEEELDLTLVGLQITDVYNPETIRLSFDGNGQLLIDLLKLCALHIA